LTYSSTAPKDQSRKTGIGGTMPKVVLERESLEALASETRVHVLKELRDKQKTITQIARAIAVDKAAVFRHLRKLSDGKLVEKDTSHSFTYYRLTWRGRAVMFPQETTRIAIMLASSFLILMVAFFSLNAYLTPRYATVLTPIDVVVIITLPPETLFLVVAVVLIGIFTVIVVASLFAVRPRKAKLTPEDEAGEKEPIFPPPPPFPGR